MFITLFTGAGQMQVSRLQQLIFVLFLTTFAALNAEAQTSQREKCEHLPQYQRLMQQTTPLQKQKMEKARKSLENFTQRFASQHKNQRTTGTALTIPVVFHVVHDNGEENIADAQIIEAVKQINEDFSAQNPEISDVVPAFQNIVADAGIQFELAKKDPNGNPTTGITRTQSSLTTNGGNIALKELIRWPRNMYLNIWIVRSSDGRNGSGFAYYPASTEGEYEVYDGVVASHWAVGRTGTAVWTHYKLLTHEIGHWANLKHTWGDQTSNGMRRGCNYDDGVNDTPNTTGTTGCDLTQESCSSLDNTQNYMDYSNCPNMFTEGQKTRMLAALNSSVAGRNNLWSAANIEATLGSGGGSTAPTAAFTTSNTNIGIGQSVVFTDQSSNNPTAWAWTFEGGSPASSNAQNPSITYNTAGTYTVSLTATNADGSGTLAKTGYIVVSDGNGISYCTASAETTSEHITRVQIGNIDNTSGSSGYTDYTSMSASISAGSSANITVNASRSWGKSKLSIWVDWNQDGDFDDNGEVTTDIGRQPYNLTLNAPANATTGSTRMRIRLSYGTALSTPCGAGATGEVEDYSISVNGANGPQNGASFVHATVYPNPSPEGKFNVVIPARNNAQNTIKVFNMQGKLVKTINTGNRLAQINMQGLPKGLYQVQINNGQKIYHQKIIFQ